jgi:predicted  nucleic acid-binding Zn-ribbon protein
MRMREQIKLLAQLQEVDKKIQTLEKDIATVPGEIIALRESIGRGEKALEDILKKLEEAEKERRHKERGLSTKEESLSKYQSQLYEVKTNKEYSALMVEIASLKQENSEWENEILTLMEQGDNLRGLMEQKKEGLSREKEKLAEEEEKNVKRVSVLEEELRKRQEEREGQVGRIEEALLTRYEKIKEGRGGLALVPVQGDACQGCFTRLPPQVINEIMQARRVIICERCSRILSMSDTEEDTD